MSGRGKRVRPSTWTGLVSKVIPAEKTLLESLDELYDPWEALETCKEEEARLPWVRLY